MVAVLMPVVFGVNAPVAEAAVEPGGKGKEVAYPAVLFVRKQPVRLGVPMPGGVPAGRLVIAS